MLIYTKNTRVRFKSICIVSCSKRVKSHSSAGEKCMSVCVYEQLSVMTTTVTSIGVASRLTQVQVLT